MLKSEQAFRSEATGENTASLEELLKDAEFLTEELGPSDHRIQLLQVALLRRDHILLAACVQNAQRSRSAPRRSRPLPASQRATVPPPRAIQRPAKVPRSGQTARTR